MKDVFKIDSKKSGKGYAVLDLSSMKVERIRLFDPKKAFDRIRREK